jgi:hypothetical protein
MAAPFPFPFCLWPRDLGLEDLETQGVICKPKTHMNSAKRTPLCYFDANFEILYQFKEKSQNYKLKFVRILFLRSTTLIKG